MRGEARESAVFDAGPLIYLDVLDYLHALRELHRVIIPEAVTRELEKHPEHQVVARRLSNRSNAGGRLPKLYAG